MPDGVVPTPLKNAVVRRIRSSSALRTAVKGGIHERVAPRRVRYPFLVFSLVDATPTYDWGGADHGKLTWHALFDISAIALNKVEAQNLDSLISQLFGGQSADLRLDELVDGLTVTLCRRSGTMPTGPDRDDEGRRIVQIGGTYEIEAYQSIPT